MGLDVRIVAYRRHLPRLTAGDLANLERRLKATPAAPSVHEVSLDDRGWTWPEKYRAPGTDEPAAHVQAVEVESGGRYFGAGYHRGDWPAYRAIIFWLRDHVSPDVWYGFEDTEPCMREADDDLLAELDAAWVESGKVSDLPSPWDPETHCPCGRTYEACGDAGTQARCVAQAMTNRAA